ncbi:MAG: hypothetical protein AAF745_05860 [Planctomycetota bacterium]
MNNSDLQNERQEFADRAAAIMQLEPVTEKTPEILASFGVPLNSRPLLADVSFETFEWHGTNFAVVVQGLRNANGQLVPHSRLPELGIQLRTGEGTLSKGLPEKTPPFVSVGRLDNGSGVVEHYARIEAGHGDHYWGKPNRSVLSEASDIPVIVIVELLDPEGKGQAKHEEIFVNSPSFIEGLDEGHPFFGWTQEQVAAMMNEIQRCGERLNIRILLVWDPESKGRDKAYRAIVEQVLSLLSDEQGIDYADVPVLLYHDLTEQQKKHLTTDDIRMLRGVE